MADVTDIEDIEAPDLPADVEKALKDKWGQLITLTHPVLGPFAFRRMSQPVYEKLVDQMQSDDASKAAAMRSCVMHCLCYPEADGKPDYKLATNLFEDMPPLTNDLLGEIRELTGTVTLKKR